MEHLLSIIIPIYNAEKYMERCIDSVLQQIFPSFELLLIDDGSTDSSSEKCDIYAKKDSRVRVFHKENEGVSSARNMGIERARGDLLSFIDSDDCIDRDMYQILIENLDRFQADVSACNFQREFDVKNVKVRTRQSIIPDSMIFEGKDIYISLTREENSIEGMVWNKVYKRSVIGNHRFRSDIAIVDDSVFSWELFKDVKRVVYCPISLYHYLVIQSSITHNSDPNKYMKALLGYELMIADARNIADSCYHDLCKQYLCWNNYAFERVALYKGENREMLCRIQENIRTHKEYIKELPLTQKIISETIGSNFFLAKIIINIKILIKKNRYKWSNR